VILRRTDKYAKLMKKCEGLPPVACAVAHPCDRDSLLGPIEAAKLGLIDPVLVGPEDKIRAVAKAEGIDLSPYRDRTYRAQSRFCGEGRSRWCEPARLKR